MDDGRLARLLGRFAVAAEAHASALEAMDVEGANRHAHLLHELYCRISAMGEKGMDGLLNLSGEKSGSVAGMAAVYGLGYDPERALGVLRRLSEDEGLLGFRARVAIERWEMGEWGRRDGNNS